MLFLLRIVLIVSLIVLLFRAFMSPVASHSGEKKVTDKRKNGSRNRKVSEEMGEYIDYEDVDK